MSFFKIYLYYFSELSYVELEDFIDPKMAFPSFQEISEYREINAVKKVGTISSLLREDSYAECVCTDHGWLIQEEQKAS